MISYVPDKTVEQNTEEMLEAMTHVKTGQVTYAVRDTKIDDKEIRQGDIMGIGDKGILAVGQGIEDITVETLKEMVDEDTEIISIYYGADVTEEDAKQLCERLEELYPCLLYTSCAGAICHRCRRLVWHGALSGLAGNDTFCKTGLYVCGNL